MTGKEALERIKNIELHHIEYEIDDYYDNDYVFEKSDGTIEENYTDEIKVIEEDLEVLNIIKRKNINTYKLIEVFKDYTIQDRQEEVSVEECNKILEWLKR